MKVYISGPISNGGILDDATIRDNMMKAVNAAETVHSWGYVPFVPHLTYEWNKRYPKSGTVWLDYDYEWLRVCDAMIRLPGESKGADLEEAFCKGKGIPVFTMQRFIELYCGPAKVGRS